MRSFRLLPTLALLLAFSTAAQGIILLDTGDPARNTSTPGNNSGWQYQGDFYGFLGTPIAPRYFITAHHFGGDVGQAFYFHGEAFVTTAVFPDPDSDLQIWQVDHDFPGYAPLYTGPGTEVGQELYVFGRGTQRGGPVTLSGDPNVRGWYWGATDNVRRWGRNTVAEVVYDGTAPYLRAAFDNPGLPSEAQLSNGDSGGAVFMLQNGLWRLAAINYGVEDVYPQASGDNYQPKSLFDARGFYQDNGNGTFSQITGPAPVPTSFYSTEIAGRLTWIQSITGLDPAALPTESFTNWLREYFTPAQVAAPTTSGPNADPDGDNVSNLLEFAFNLDPTYAEPVTMTAVTGLRGLPLVGVTQMGTDRRMTLEFVRRTAASGSGITYTPLFSFSLDPRSVTGISTGTETVTPINARWERVKVTDTLSLSVGKRERFARVRVTQDPAKTPDTAQLAASRK